MSILKSLYVLNRIFCTATVLIMKFTYSDLQSHGSVTKIMLNLGGTLRNSNGKWNS